ncbi:hypothetical protein T492DRAFT_1124017 [Pavlovales sp. CCMP2436]|nr:hypothetical protein T492DRAFT_1124017 [Pavlovales sp. CCMP2436]
MAGLLRYFFFAIAALLVLHNVYYWPAQTQPTAAHRFASVAVPSAQAAGTATMASAATVGATGVPSEAYAGETGAYVHRPSVVVSSCLPKPAGVRLTRPLKLLPLALGECAPGAPERLCAAARLVFRSGTVLVVPVSEVADLPSGCLCAFPQAAPAWFALTGTLDEWAEFAAGAHAAGATNLLVLAVTKPGSSEADSAALVAQTDRQTDRSTNSQTHKRTPQVFIIKCWAQHLMRNTTFVTWGKGG